MFGMHIFRRLFPVVAFGILFCINCASVQTKVTPPDIELTQDEVFYTKTVIKVRENYSLESKVLKVLPTNSQLICNRETTSTYEIDGLTAKWYKCKTQKTEGWSFGGYFSRFRVLEPLKTNIFHSMGNDTADVNLELSKLGTFNLKMIVILNSKGDNLSWQGKWWFKNNRLTLQFLESRGTERYLFFWRPEDEKLTETADVKSLGNSTYLIDLTDGIMAIWGVTCEIVKVTP